MTALASAPLPPLPDASELLDATIPRRPGDMHEAFALAPSTAQRVAEEATSLGVGLDVAASLLLEAGLATNDVGSDLVKTLDGALQRPTHPLSAAEANYIRSLTVGRRPRRAARRELAAIPIRLLRRLGTNTAEDVVETVELEIAISWEVAAVLDGRTMTEWVLANALRRP